MKFPFYTMVYAGWVLAAAPFYMARGLRTGKYLWNFADRMGLRPLRIPAKTGRRAWVHSLSLGEVISSAELVRRLASDGWEVCLSTTTLSGRRVAEERIDSSVPRLCFPLDLPGAVRRITGAVDPDLFVLVETDIWPNMLAVLADRETPAVLVNGRVSPRSLRGYRLLKPLWSRVLGLFTCIGCQTELDRERMLSLGAPPERTVVTGNLKFDRPAPPTGPEFRAALLAEAGLPDGLWLAAGSTHKGEEEALLDMFLRLRERFAGLRLMLAPRQAERFEAVWRLAGATGLKAARRSGGRPAAEPDIFLLDTQGELDRFYELADLVFMGKSLPGADEGGGHNLLEPAARRKPVLFGPLMQNFAEMAAEMTAAGGGFQAADASGLEILAAGLLAEPERLAEAGRRAYGVFDSHRGALERTLELIRRAAGERR